MCFGDNNNGFFIVVVDSGLEVEGYSSHICSYQSKGKLSRKHRVLALHAIYAFKEKVVLIGIYKAYFVARPTASLHESSLQSSFC